MNRRTPSQEIETLRKFRNRPAKDVSIVGELSKLEKEFSKQRKAVGGLDVAWDELAPPAVRAAGSVVRITPGGLLVLRVASASAKYEVDIWLRSGGMDQLKARSAKALRGVRFEGGK